MKKVLKYIIWGLILILIGFCAYMESKYALTRIVKVEVMQEKVLEEYPEIAITQDDLELEKYILGLPEVQMMIDQAKKEGSYVSVIKEEASALLSGWIEDGWTMLEFGCTDDTVYLFWGKTGDKHISYNFSVDGSYPIQKTIGIYHRHLNGDTSVDVIYGNANGIVEKNVVKRLWFHWVNELLTHGYKGNIFFK